MTWNPDVDGFRKNRNAEEVRKFDPYAHAVTMITEPHRLAHDGFVYHTSKKWVGVANGAAVDVLFDVPANTYPHIQKMEIFAGAGDIDFALYEGVTVSANGTLCPCPNVNRNSSNTGATQIYVDPTVTDTGTLIADHWVPPTSTGQGQSQQGVSNASEGEEWIFAPSTKYVKRITNNSGNAVDMYISIVWYEIGYER